MKKTNFRRVLLLSLLTAFLLTATFTPASAQSGLRAVLSQPDLTRFPSLTTYVDVYDALGSFVSDLNTEQFTLQEDGQNRTINEATRTEPGLHTILALNLAPTLSNRISEDSTRFQDIIFITSTWLENLSSQASNLYSFTTNERAFIQRSSNPDELLQALQGYQPNLFNFEPDQTSLSYALDIAAQQPQLENNGKQVIFYITPLPLDSDLDQIPVLAARAADIGIPVYVWLIANDSSSNSKAADTLRNLAQTTGGQFFLYSEKVETPNPETYLAPLRYTYRLRYTSAISQSGFHHIQVQVERGVQQAKSQDVSFQIELLPPQVTIIALPPQIQRVWVDSEDDGKVLKPEFITLQVSVTFPDGYPRQLKYSRLIVDGQEIVKIDQQPFEWLGWPLDGYRITGLHGILIEVEDILGFRSLSDPRQVDIIVEARYTGFWGGFVNFIQSGGWILFAVLALFAALAGYLTLRRRNPRFVTAPGMEPAISFSEDPLTQQVIIPPESANATSTPHSDSIELLPRLLKLSGFPGQIQQIFIGEANIILGSDPQQVTQLLEHLSVSPRHARLYRSPQGMIILADLGSESGTWVNYAPVSSKGTVLQNNDLIHIGEVAYRFELVAIRKKK